MVLSGSPRKPGSPNPLGSSLYELPGREAAWRLDRPASLAQGTCRESGRERGAARLEPQNLLSCYNSWQGLPGPRTIFLNGVQLPVRGPGQRSSANCRSVHGPGRLPQCQGPHCPQTHTTLTECPPWVPQRWGAPLGPCSRYTAESHKHSLAETPSVREHPGAQVSPTDCPPAPEDGGLQEAGREGGACRGRGRRVGALGHVLSLRGQR